VLLLLCGALHAMVVLLLQLLLLTVVVLLLLKVVTVEVQMVMRMKRMVEIEMVRVGVVVRMMVHHAAVAVALVELAESPILHRRRVVEQLGNVVGETDAARR
jgi:hypothetical protein